METLDGNAIGGVLFDVFGREMTSAACACAYCGTHTLVAELEVYLGGPGIVTCCRTCRAIVMVLVEVRGVMCVDVRGLASLEA